MTDYRSRLRDVREDRDLTQAEVGEILNKSQQGYNHIEAGRAELKIDDLVKLCQFYNLTADYLVGLSDLPHTELQLKSLEKILIARRARSSYGTCFVISFLIILKSSKTL